MTLLLYMDEAVEIVDEKPATLDREHQRAVWPAPEGWVWCRWGNGKHWLHWREQLDEYLEL